MRTSFITAAIFAAFDSVEAVSLKSSAGIRFDLQSIKNLLGGTDTSGQSNTEHAVCEIAPDAPLWDIYNGLLPEGEITYEQHEVTTETGYKLTLMRLLLSGESTEDASKRPPVLFLHGLTMTAENWFTVKDKGQEPGATPLQALRAGYDVWLNNNRGTRYSIGHDKDTESEKYSNNPKYWDFGMEQMGLEDNKANIEKVLEMTGKDKLSVVGFSLGTMSTFYGLAMDSPWFEQRVSVFAALAPCTKLTHSTYSFMQMGSALYDRSVEAITASGATNLYGPNWQKTKEDICAVENALVCMGIKDTCVGDGQAISVRTIVHGMQSMMKDQFCEYDPDLKVKADLAASKERTKEVPLANVQGVPIHMFVGQQDTICSPLDAQWTKEQLTGTDVQLTEVQGDHFRFTVSDDLSYFSSVIEILDQHQDAVPKEESSTEETAKEDEPAKEEDKPEEEAKAAE